MDHKPTQAISKSKFVAGCQCLKRLYWQVHEPDLATESDAAAYAIMEQGHEVGLLAGNFLRAAWKSSGKAQSRRSALHAS